MHGGWAEPMRQSLWDLFSFHNLLLKGKLVSRDAIGDANNIIMPGETDVVVQLSMSSQLIYRYISEYVYLVWNKTFEFSLMQIYNYLGF